MNLPNDLSYAKSHEWVKMLGDGRAQVGITEFAQSELGDIVFISLPAVGDSVTVGESFADVESVKAASDIYAPLSGVVSRINDELEGSPELINSDPYGAWLIEVSDITDKGEFLSAKEYAELIEKGE